ncbi:MAG: hypothetical protein QOF57_1378 [Frankiaceae bacterium]|jgi:hypothetical protein|nr:hypothetical protein [Frankiaceae bacterium]
MTNADTPRPGEELETGPEEINPPLLFDLRTQLGGPRGVFDSSVPGVVMAVATVFTSVWRAIVAALVAAALLAVFRLVRREPVRQTAMSLGGIALCYLLARSTGSAKTFFLPGILLNGGYAVAMLISLVIRRPVIAYAAAMLDSRYQHWQRHPPLQRAATRATLLWLVVFALRFFVVGTLYLQDRADLLPVTRLILGLPLYVAAIGLTVLMLRSHAQKDPLAD